MLRPDRTTSGILRRNPHAYARGVRLAMLESFAVKQKASTEPTQHSTTSNEAVVTSCACDRRELARENPKTIQLPQGSNLEDR